MPHFFNEWLNNIAQRFPCDALSIAEIYLRFVKSKKPYFYDHKDQLVQMMTKLFARAEEQEESDNGAMLMRVVELQDILLSLSGSSMEAWLVAAEERSG